jgi:DNA replication protein DnaC
MTRDELLAVLKKLGIRTLINDLDDFLLRAQKEKWKPQTLIEHLAVQETREREHRSLQWRLRDSKINNFVPMTDFDWRWPKKIDRKTIERLLTANFADRKENVIFVASHGLGKTMIAKNLIHRAVLKGHTALFVEAAEMLVDLASQDSARALDRRLKHYAKPSVLCIDEVGYLPCDQRAADLFFQIVSRRYEKKSIIITTNLAFSDWNTVFPGATSVVSLVDRLIHHSEITSIEGDSYRRKQAEEQKRERNKRRKAKK